MGKTIRASALVLLLACSSNAGIMQNGSPAPPPPPPPQTTGTMQSGSPQPPPTSAQSAEEMAVDGQEAITAVRPETLLLVRVALNLLMLF